MTSVDRLDGIRGGLGIKAPVRLATTGNITLSGLQTIDGVLTAEGDRVLVKNQNVGAQNGIYNASSGNWTRALDFNGARDVVSGTQVFVSRGAVNSNFLYAISTADPIVIGTTAITFTFVGMAIIGQNGLPDWQLNANIALGQPLDVSMFGVVAGLSADGVENSARYNEAISYCAANGHMLTVKDGPIVIGDSVTGNTCLQARSNLTIWHAPGVTYINRGVGRINPRSTNIVSAVLAALPCFMQLDGHENGALENFTWLGHPMIDGEGAGIARRGFNTYGEINNLTMEAWGHDMRDLLFVVSDVNEEDNWLSFGDGIDLSIWYTGTMNLAAGQLANFFPRKLRSDGSPAFRNITLRNMRMDGTNGSSLSVDHITDCLKLNSCDNVSFIGYQEYRGGASSGVSWGNGTRNVTGAVKTIMCKSGVVVSNGYNRLASAPTSNINLTIEHDEAGVDNGSGSAALRFQGNCPRSKFDIQSTGYAFTIAESDGERFAVTFDPIAAGASTVTIASPGVVTLPAGWAADKPFKWTTTGHLPSILRGGGLPAEPLVPGREYWCKTDLGGNQFTFAETKGGAAINTTGTQAGTHTATRTIAYGERITTSGGVSADIIGWSQTHIVVSRGGSLVTGLYGSLAPLQTFSISGGMITGVVGVVDNMDGQHGLTIDFQALRGGFYMETVSPAPPSGVKLKPLTGARINGFIDGLGEDTPSICLTGSRVLFTAGPNIGQPNDEECNWWMDDSDITLRFVRPPIYCLMDYSRNSRVRVSSDGKATLSAPSAIVRVFGNSEIWTDLGKDNTRHAFHVVVERDASNPSVVGAQPRIWQMNGGVLGSTGVGYKARTAGQLPVRGSRRLEVPIIDLSGAAIIHYLANLARQNLFVTGVEIHFPIGTTADAGVALQLGIRTALTNCLNITTPTSVAAGHVVEIGQTAAGGGGGSTLIEQPQVSGLLTWRSAGGKTGADLAKVFIDVVDMKPAG